MKLTAKAVIAGILVVALTAFFLTGWGAFTLALFLLGKVHATGFIAHVLAVFIGAGVGAGICLAITIGLLILAQPVFDRRLPEEK